MHDKSAIHCCFLSHSLVSQDSRESKVSECKQTNSGASNDNGSLMDLFHQSSSNLEEHESCFTISV